MNDHEIEEMADAISNELHVPTDDVLRILHLYWQDRIAVVWQVDDLLEAALDAGQPITRDDAVEVLKDIFEGHDAELGITWTTLVVALQEYHLDWKRLPEDRYGEVQGVFKVWRKGNPIAFQVGLFPDHIHGNLPKALTLAKSLADQTPNMPILIGCESRHSDDVEAWLSVTREEDSTQVEEECHPQPPASACASRSSRKRSDHVCMDRTV
jgi:hypothetical protein